MLRQQRRQTMMIMIMTTRALPQHAPTVMSLIQRMSQQRLFFPKFINLPARHGIERFTLQPKLQGLGMPHPARCNARRDTWRPVHQGHMSNRLNTTEVAESEVQRRTALRWLPKKKIKVTRTTPVGEVTLPRDHDIIRDADLS